MNPLIDPDVIAAAYEEDPSMAARSTAASGDVTSRRLSVARR